MNMPRGQGGVTRIPYCVLRNDWTEYGIRNTNLCRLAQRRPGDPSAADDHAIFKAGTTSHGSPIPMKDEDTD